MDEQSSDTNLLSKLEKKESVEEILLSRNYIGMKLQMKTKLVYLYD